MLRLTTELRPSTGPDASKRSKFVRHGVNTVPDYWIEDDQSNERPNICVTDAGGSTTCEQWSSERRVGSDAA